MPADDQPHRALALCCATFLLGNALQLSDGRYKDNSILWVTLGLLALLAGLVPFEVGPRAARVMERALPPLAAALLGTELLLLLSRPAGTFLQLSGPHPERILDGSVAVAALAVAALFFWPSRSRGATLAFVVALACYAVAGTWLIQASPDPAIDVHVIARRGLPALLHGQNPYAIAYPNIYPDPEPFYGWEWVRGNDVRFGYAYMPVTLFLALPGLLLGDYRFAHLGAMVLSAALIAWARPGRNAMLLALLALFTPRGLFVLEQGWVEPLVLLVVAFTMLAAVRWPRVLPYAFGVLLVSKQFMAVAVVLWRSLRSSGTWFEQRAALARAAAVGAVVTLPMVLWNPEAFWRSAVQLQLALKFRRDALSYPALLLRHFGVHLSHLWALAALAVVLAWGALRVDRTPAGFLNTLAAGFCLFFAFNKAAFCNYYYLVLVLAAWGAALAAQARAQDPALRAG